MTGPLPTLLVFTLGPEAEARRKRLLPSRWSGVEERLYGGCLSAAIAAGRESGCRVLVSSPAPLALDADVIPLEQRGETFGRRIAHSLEQVDAGTAWVLVGTDSPDLSAAVVREALDALVGDALAGEARRVVIGPSPDGGFYLLAANTQLSSLLAGTRWHSRSTCEDLRRALEAAGFEIRWLSPLADLDARRDLERWLAHIRRESTALWRAFVGLLSTLLAGLKLCFLPPELLRPRAAFAGVRRGRAPPRLR